MWKLRLLARVDVGTGVGAGTRRDAMVRSALFNAQQALAVTFVVPKRIDVDCECVRVRALAQQVEGKDR